MVTDTLPSTDDILHPVAHSLPSSSSPVSGNPRSLAGVDKLLPLVVDALDSVDDNPPSVSGADTVVGSLAVTDGLPSVAMADNPPLVAATDDPPSVAVADVPVLPSSTDTLPSVALLVVTDTLPSVAVADPRSVDAVLATKAVHSVAVADPRSVAGVDTVLASLAVTDTLHSVAVADVAVPDTLPSVVAVARRLSSSSYVAVHTVGDIPLSVGDSHPSVADGRRSVAAAGSVLRARRCPSCHLTIDGGAAPFC